MEAIKKAIDEAELTAGVEIDSCTSGCRERTSRHSTAAAWWRSRRNREITREDVRRALEAAKAVALPAAAESYVLPQDFVVDEQDGMGARSE